LHKRKIEREREREERDRERESVQRQKETEYHKEWEKQEDSVTKLIFLLVYFRVIVISFLKLVSIEANKDALKNTY
jgi:hypothetical protein